MYIKITGGWTIDFVIKKEKTIVICRLLAIYRNVFYSNLVTRESQKMSQYKVFRSTIIAVQREEKSRIVAYIEATSYF